VTGGGRRFLAAIATVFASVAMFATLLAVYANHALVNSAGFSDRAVKVVRSADVESLIAETVTDRVVADAGDQLSLEPVAAEAVRTALSNGQITEAVRVAAHSLHGELMSGAANSLTLTLPDVGPSIASSIGADNPELVAVLNGIGSITVVDVRIPPTDARILHHVTTAARESSPLFILTVALALLAMFISPERLRTLRGLGVGALVAGLLAAIGYLVGRGVLIDRFSSQDARTAAGAAWRVYLGGLETWGFVLAGIGLAIVCATTVRLSRGPIR
jgi:hypothetical protein